MDDESAVDVSCITLRGGSLSLLVAIFFTAAHSSIEGRALKQLTTKGMSGSWSQSSKVFKAASPGVIRNISEANPSTNPIQPADADGTRGKSMVDSPTAMTRLDIFGIRRCHLKKR